MERITKHIDKLAVSKRKVKILCRNSYERKVAHSHAQQKGLTHRSIIDYTKYHLNRNVKLISSSGCCHDCDGFEITVSATPYSYVEINGGMLKETIGDPSTIPQKKQVYSYGTTISSRMCETKTLLSV